MMENAMKIQGVSFILVVLQEEQVLLQEQHQDNEVGMLDLVLI
jgi:hypothetical protein